MVRPLLLVLGLVGLAAQAQARMSVAAEPFVTAFTPIHFVSPQNFAKSIIDEAKRADTVRKLCAEVNGQFKRYKWSDEACGKVQWKTALSSDLGRPLLYAEFGKGKETTLILGGVHPEELTPVHLAFRAARTLAENPGLIHDDEHVVIAPLVNPDGFLRERATRTNGNGVDLNRNFFTMDWYEKAKKLWTDRRNRVAAHFPGYFPNSEIETIFQIQLIDTYKPDKILSIHAPLGFLDYDGPGDNPMPRKLTTSEIKAKQLVTSVSEKSRNYKVVEYTFYPGSLGNYAGNERKIPTVTLELETTEPNKVELYWNQFWPGIQQCIHYDFVTDRELGSEDGANASPFSSQYGPQRDRTI